MIYPFRYLLLFTAVIYLLTGCSDTSRPQQQPGRQAGTDTTKTDTSAHLRDLYSNPAYNIAFRIPESWILVEEPSREGSHFSISLFKRGTGAAQELPLGIHAAPGHSYVTVWPKGLGTELPSGKRISFSRAADPPDLSFAVDTAKSKILQLDSGAARAYFIVPKEAPQNWSDNGFIYAQIQIAGHQTNCFDQETGRELSMKECEPLEGDRFVRKGSPDKADAAIIREVLESISLKPMQQKKAAEDMVEIEQPLPNMDVSSPLTVKGKARGNWYFEGSFSIKLYDAFDNLLADTVAKAQEPWTTEKFVPFKATLAFDAPDDQRGRLVLERANPSGLPQNEQYYSQPVIFPPK